VAAVFPYRVRDASQAGLSMTEAIPASVSTRMRRVGSKDTPPEVALRRALWARGLRYRTGNADLPGKPDIASRTRKLAVFVDGDYWHGGQWRRRGLACLEDQFTRASRRDYWLAKIRGNMARDARVTRDLLSDGWTVVRLWESSVERDVDACADTVMQAVDGDTAPTGRALAPRKTVADFFAGIGLHRYALERHGWSTVFANDIDPAKREMHDAHFRDDDPHYHVLDVHDLSASDVPDVSLAIASFPCNDLSLAGGRRGLAGPHSSAFWGFTRVIDEMRERRPPLIMLENVPGFLTSRKGADLEVALGALNDLGYSVDVFALDARHFVPQSRRRVFIVATLDGCLDERPSADAPLDESDLRPRALFDFIDGRPGIRWAVRSLPQPPRSDLALSDVLDDLPPTDDAWWSEDRASYLLSQMSPKHREIADRMIDGGRVSHGAVFRRVRKGVTRAELRTDGIAGCLRTPRGGSARQILFQAGKGRYAVRLLSGRECARLMGADDYRLDGSLNRALFGFGDAVCVPVIEWIARYYLDPLVNEMIHGVPLRADSIESLASASSERLPLAGERRGPVGL
jgi:DNA (cytosine-5)-methyltransferase 1